MIFRHVIGLASIVTLLGIGSTPVNAEEPEIGVVVPFKSDLFEWEVSGDDESFLLISERPSGKTMGRYELFPCSFCSGPEDNCDRDGIQEIRIEDQSEEPILAAVCHVGAHSQRLAVYAPMRDHENPVFVATGSYWVDYELEVGRLKVTYDKRDTAGEFIEVQEYWPSNSNHQ